MWTDNETTDDLLGFRVHADLIRAVVMDESLLPVTIGILGDWGGGKTSVLRMLEQDLDPDRWQDPAEKAKYEPAGGREIADEEGEVERLGHGRLAAGGA